MRWGFARAGSARARRGWGGDFGRPTGRKVQRTLLNLVPVLSVCIINASAGRERQRPVFLKGAPEPRRRWAEEESRTGFRGRCFGSLSC